MSLRRALVAAVLVAALAACGGDDETEVVSEEDRSSTDAGTVSMTVVFDQPPSEEDVDATTAVIRQRLDGLDVADATIEHEDGELVIRFPESASIDPDAVRAVIEESGDLAFRPVLQVLPPAEAPDCQAASGPLLPEYAAGDLVQCYELGPATLTGDGVLTASAEESGIGGWAVALELHPGADGLTPFNELAAMCFNLTPPCPSGRVAIVLDDEVMSAPSIQQPTFDETGVSIVGDFSASQAETLAVVLRSGALPVDLSVEEIESSG